MTKPIWALSLKNPWGWLMCKNLKDGENRNWSLPSFVYNQRVYIHASQSTSDMTPKVYDWIMERLKPPATFEFQAVWKRLVYGAIIGDVVFYGNQRDSKSIWYTGDNFFVCKDGHLYDKPIFCRGQLNFFKPEVFHGT